MREWPQDLFIPPDALEVVLESFEGPLDLLLYLIRKQNLDNLNIPVADILQPEWQDLLALDGMNFIFYSNSDLLASQAWLICKRKGNENIAVMKGGMNRWVETILQPEAPLSTAPGEDFALYQFRVGASIYFGGAKEISTEITSEPLPMVRKKKKTVTEGGC